MKARLYFAYRRMLTKEVVLIAGRMKHIYQLCGTQQLALRML